MAEYIEREAAIRCCTFGRTSLGLIEELRWLPAADVVEVRHGRWIVHTTWNGMFGLIHSECSECKFDRNGDLSSWKFCPNCGADMREVSENARTD